ncbi:MAG: hypothetical protein EOM18_03590 [Clostridia bacterium]|nr:hypothetical protein [Clostridia bacterium]
MEDFIALILIIWIGLSIVAGIGRNSHDFKSTEYHKDWDSKYNSWKMKGVDDNTARTNSLKEVQKDKKNGKYDK